MIKVDYVYKKKNGEVKSYSMFFYTCTKAVRFIYSILGKKNYVYHGFGCDNQEELEEMEYLLK